jgi:predicted membrane-bound dolichyl-phosphate-mannose-protein mannosyltransferase
MANVDIWINKRIIKYFMVAFLMGVRFQVMRWVNPFLPIAMLCVFGLICTKLMKENKKHGDG